MRPIVPGNFNGATVCTDAGELQLRLSEGGNWQLKARVGEEFEWSLLCTGNLDGDVFAPPREDDRAPIRLGPLTVDVGQRLAHVEGRAATLTAREFDLLAVLVEEPGRVFSKSQLLRSLWGYPDASRSRTLESHASRLRCKLRRIGADGFVVNYRERGYKLWEEGEPAAAAPVSLRSV